MTDTQHLVWLLSANACSEVNLAMRQLTSVNYMTSEQHIDMSASRHGRHTKAHLLLDLNKSLP